MQANGNVLSLTRSSSLCPSAQVSLKSKYVLFHVSGACEGTLACSTCHLVFEENIYNRLDPVVDEEVDMLDLAYGVSNT